MGEVVGAGLLAHVPTIMLPEETRRELNKGEDFSLVGALEDLRADVFEKVDYDTVVVLDSHWFTTVEFVVTAQDRRAGLFTSEELPRGMKQIPFDWRGDPELAWAMDEYSSGHSTWVTAIDDQYLPVFYATVNLWKYLGEGLDKRWISVSVAQTGVTEDFLRAGRALGQAIEASDRKVMLIASGAMSHTFWKLRELRDHEAADLSSIRTPEARAADEERIEWLKEGNHAKLLETMDDFLRYRPESMFAHYLMMLGAVGEEQCTAPARQYGEYENSIGTGQVHLWCDRPDSGFPRHHDTPSDPEFVRQQAGPDVPAAG
jgi:aromatic ring-opening dioxygenase catalytic subunit (LigB family)